MVYSLTHIKQTQLLSVVSKIIRAHLQCSLLPPRAAPHIGNKKKKKSQGDCLDCLLKLLELDLQHLLSRPGYWPKLLCHHLKPIHVGR